MISAVTMRRVGQLISENNTLRQRLDDLKAERDFFRRRLADYQHLDLPTQQGRSCVASADEQHMTLTRLPINQ